MHVRVTDDKLPFMQSGASSSEYTWRIDLTETQRYWAGWFEGLSSLFLTTTIPKILILAGIYQCH